MQPIKIKEFINRVGIKSQEDLARRLGVGKGTVSMWAKGKRYPTHQTEAELLEMGMTIEELFGKAYPSTVRDLKPRSEMLDIMIDALAQVRRNIGDLKPQGEDK